MYVKMDPPQFAYSIWMNRIANQSCKLQRKHAHAYYFCIGSERYRALSFTNGFVVAKSSAITD